jgi:hypothetical protein
MRLQGGQGVRIFKNKLFIRFARKAGISNAKLCQAVKEMESGKIDADYGGGVVKQRIAHPHAGKSGGYRSVILYHRGNKSFFVYGFAKNERENMNKVQERNFKQLAKALFAFSDDEIAKIVKTGACEEIMCNG